MIKSKWYLNISKEEFKEIYKGTSVADDVVLFESKPETDKEYVEKFLTSKLWRLNNLYTIRDKFGVPMKFNLHRAQHVVYANSIRHSRLIILKSRQQGISTLWLISYFDDAIFLDNMNCGLMAQDADAAKDLLERIDYAWEDMDDPIKQFLGIQRTVNNSKETSFSNGSKMYVRTSFRSGTLTRLHISELGKIANKYPDKARETNSGSLQAIKPGNTVIIESTAEGRNNMFADKWKTAENYLAGGSRLSDLHFMPVFLSWLDDPDCNIKIRVDITKADREYFELVERETDYTLKDTQKWWAAAKRSELKEEFDREYPFNPESAFSQARDGTYYGKYIKELKVAGRLVDGGIHEPELDVIVTFDLGMSDTFVMLFWQEDKTVSGKVQVRLIDEYHANGESLHHYIAVLRERNYKYSRFVLPHDARKRELGSAKSIAKQLYDLGLRKQTVLPREEILAGIQATRELMPVLWIDKQKCDYVVSAFENYTKEWDDARGVWKDKPLHDEWSNPMDAVRYYSMYRRKLFQRNVVDGSKDRTTNVIDGLAM